VSELLERLDHANHDLAVEIATIPDLIRGYGHIKRRHLDNAKKKEAELLTAFRASQAAAKAA
jgi:indolepyruvate ferredoxin oxidoreductase